MKKSLIGVIPMLIMSLIVKSQSKNPTVDSGKNIYTYTYNFSNPAPNNFNIIKTKNLKDVVFIKIININRIAFNINGIAKNTSIVLSDNSLFDSLANSLNAPKTSTSPAPGASTGLVKRKPILNNNDPLNTAYNNIQDNYSKLNSEFIKMTTNMKQLGYFINFSKTVPIVISEERGNQANLKSKILNDINLKLFSSSISNLDNLISVSSTLPQSLANNISDSYNKIVGYEKANDSLYNVLMGLCTNPSNKSQNICEDLAKTKNIIPSSVNTAITQASKIKIDSVSKAVRILNNLISQVNDSSNFTYYSPAFYPQGDYLQIGIKITPKDPKGPFTADSLLYKIPISGQFEWAIGPALNFGFTNNSFDRSYQIDSARNSNGTAKKNDMFTIKQNKSNKVIAPSIGVMASFYWQSHNTVTPGICVGVSTAPTDISTIRAYLGGSLLLGGFSTDSKNNLIFNKLIFSAGLAYGQVSRLKENLIIGDNPKSQVPFNGSAIASDQLTEQVGRIGLFFGFTYKIN